MMKFTLLLMTFLQAACSYHVRRGDFKLGGAKNTEQSRIFIPIVDNLTVRTGFEPVITSSVRKALTQVSGVELVNDASEAQYFLLGTVLSYDVTTRFVRPGTESSQSMGGLVSGQGTSQDFKLVINVRFQLTEKTQDTHLNHEIWTRDFSVEGVYDASNRLNKAGGDVRAGSESAPHINDARESIQVHILAESLASKVLDQVVQDF